MPVVPVVVTPQRLVALCGISLNRCGPFKVGMSERSLSYEMFRGVNCGGSLFLFDWSQKRFWFLLPFGSG